jgi:UDP-GlcNAc:undecaprenyl-phosphate GlcNAc-1-phosphate transferase
MVAISFLSGLAISVKPMVSSYSRSVFLIDWVVLTILLVTLRIFLKKMYLRYRAADDSKDAKRVLIWGAGDAGELCLRFLKKSKNPVYTVAGFLDDDSGKRSRQIEGYKILGDRHHLKVLAQLYKIQEVLVAIPSATSDELQEIISACQQLGLEVQLFQFRTTVACSRITLESEQPAISREDSVLGEWIPSLDQLSR